MNARERKCACVCENDRKKKEDRERGMCSVNHIVLSVSESLLAKFKYYITLYPSRYILVKKKEDEEKKE